MKTGSPRRLTLTINGRSYLVQVEDLDSSPVTVIVNGEPYEVELGPGAYHDEAVADLEVPPSPGAPLRRKPRRETPITPAGPAADQISAPMPGDILDITVSPGDRVTTGQQLCALEAMKMKSAIRSPRDGIIKSVDVSEGQTVGHGEVLVTFE